MMSSSGPATPSCSPARSTARPHLTAKIPLNLPDPVVPDGHRHRAELAIAAAGAGGGAGGSSTRTPLTVEEQAREVDKVKRSENGIIVDPVTLPPDATVGAAHDIMHGHNISGVPIVVGGRLRGILTRRDLRFLEETNIKIEEVMTKDNLVTAPADTSLEEADRILTKNKVEKLLLVDDDYRLKGLITIKDIDKLHRYPHACKDARGRLRVGAAVGVHDHERVRSLLDADVDVLIVDSAHGHSKNVVETVRRIKGEHAIEVIAGNVATAEGARALIEAGADAVKVGDQGRALESARRGSSRASACPRSRPSIEVTAPRSREREGAGDRRRRHPLLGRHHQGDRRPGAPLHVMIGGLFAGLAESPGDTIIYRGRSFKTYRGMGSLAAMAKGSHERYRQGEGRGQDKSDGAVRKLVPEGVEGRVPYKGPLADYVFQLVGGLRAGMGYCGTRTIDELRTNARFIQITGASVQEGHPHDIVITQEAPNYSSFSNENETVRSA